LVQMGRASVDTAEFSQQSLDVSRQHMELSKQLLEQGRTAAASFASLSAQRPDPTTGSQVSGPEQGVSYANQPASNGGAVKPDDEPAAIAASSPKAITKEDQILLTPLASDIVYKDGKYVVAGKPFLSKDEATEFQKSLAPIATK
jgi:hypothetical protein